jgi:t-SNARE complex subunit, syntaxin
MSKPHSYKFMSILKENNSKQILNFIYTSTCCNFCFCLQDSYLESRAETMQNIESTVVELGGIFQQLAHMVKEQEEMVERLEFQRCLVDVA